jgi:hypothetical protein
MNLACNKQSGPGDEEVLAIEDLLVENNEITGWTYSSTNWIANNITELTTYINGGAEIYQSYGFVEGACQSYEGSVGDGVRELKVTIYNMSTESNASDTYDDPNCGISGGTDWPDGAGVRANFIRHGLAQELAFYKSSYFVKININYDSDESLNIIKQFALNIDGKIQ